MSLKPRSISMKRAAQTGLLAAALGIVTSCSSASGSGLDNPPTQQTPITIVVEPTATVVPDFLAGIREHEPELADLIREQPRFGDGITFESFVELTSDYISSGSYLFNTVTVNGRDYGILTVGDDNAKNILGLEISTSILRMYADRIDNERIPTLLPVIFEDFPTGAGTANNSYITLGTNAALPSYLHEVGGHLIYEGSVVPPTRLTGWFKEAAAQYLSVYFENVLKSEKPTWFNEESLKTLRDDPLNPHISTIDLVSYLTAFYEENPGEFEPASEIEIGPGLANLGKAMNVGLTFLGHYNILVGDDNFWDGMNEVADARFAIGPDGKPKHEFRIDEGGVHRYLTHQAVVDILGQYVPEDRTEQFDTLAGKYIFGTVPITES
jgi:hypothetical protein